MKTNISDLIGVKKDKLTIVNSYKKNNKIYVVVNCECGTMNKHITYDNFLNKSTKSCGCYKRELARSNIKPHTFHIGETYKTNEGCLIEIINYENKNNVLIRFLEDIPYERKTTMQNIKNGQLKYPYFKSVYNVGYYGIGDFKARINGKKTDFYIKWFSMMTRCYDEKYQLRQPTYKGCSVDKDFHCFQNFAKWMENNLYECNEPLELDKDLFSNDKNNKIYSKETCCFLPKSLNIKIKTKKHDKDFMKQVYDEYNKILPKRILNRIEFLSQH